MNKTRLILGILIFGSIWGFSECVIGNYFNDAGLPTAELMVGFFAITFLVLSRIYFHQPGMQIGMGLVAGTLRLFNPMGCHLCSAVAIIAEGAIFELIWYKLSFDLRELKTLTMQVSMGIISSYVVFISGYIITQVLTPVIAGTGFFIENLLIIMPNILAGGVIPALIGGFVVPAVILVKRLDLTIKDRIYYPTTIGITILCWFIVIGNWLLA
jgi:hypothetical protein